MIVPVRSVDDDLVVIVLIVDPRLFVRGRLRLMFRWWCLVGDGLLWLVVYVPQLIAVFDCDSVDGG